VFLQRGAKRVQILWIVLANRPKKKCNKFKRNLLSFQRGNPGLLVEVGVTTTTTTISVVEIDQEVLLLQSPINPALLKKTWISREIPT